ncbi:hypothetical protein [Paramagnetospirillum magneticum]|nr:hypothetical protein [Paramagnetospirillum magneticum]
MKTNEIIEPDVWLANWRKRRGPTISKERLALIGVMYQDMASLELERARLELEQIKAETTKAEAEAMESTAKAKYRSR